MIRCIIKGLFRDAFKIEGKLEHQSEFVTAPIVYFLVQVIRK